MSTQTERSNSSPVLEVYEILCTEHGIPCQVEYPGYIEIHDRWERRWCIGTANVNWGADLCIHGLEDSEEHNNDSELAKFPSDSKDYKGIAKAIATMVTAPPWIDLVWNVNLAVNAFAALIDQAPQLTEEQRMMILQKNALIRYALRRFASLEGDKIGVSQSL